MMMRRRHGMEGNPHHHHGTKPPVQTSQQRLWGSLIEGFFGVFEGLKLHLFES